MLSKLKPVLVYTTLISGESVIGNSGNIVLTDVFLSCTKASNYMAYHCTLLESQYKMTNK